jgi:nitroreductase
MMSEIERKTEHEIAPVFTDRWSPRSFTGETIPRGVLMQLFEAARWAPSSYNYQPWRFLYSIRESSDWRTFVDLLTDVNRVWAHRASALIYVLSDSQVLRPGQDKPLDSLTHIFDTGSAFAQLSLQATLIGWHTHGMQGFDKERAHVELAIPAHFRVNAAVAVGKIGQKSLLSEALQAREKPSERKPLAEIVSAGKMPAAWETPAKP